MKNFSAKYSGQQDEATTKAIMDRYKGIQGNWVNDNDSSQNSPKKQIKSTNVISGINEDNLEFDNITSIDKAIHQSTKFFNNRKKYVPPALKNLNRVSILKIS